MPTKKYQRTPSIWMILAIAQSYLWLFGLPILCRKYWDSLFQSLSPEQSEMRLLLATAFFCLAFYNLVMLPIYYIQHPFFEQHKINPSQPWPWLDKDETVRSNFWILTRKSIVLSLFNVFVLLPFFSFLKLHLVNEFIYGSPSSFSTETWPTPYENTRDILLMCIFHELGFYVTHRMMHIFPFLYKYHKVHHEYKFNTTLAAQYNHPVDYMFTIAFPFLVAVVLVPWAHSVSVFQLTIWTLVANLDDHVGYSFPWSPVRWFPFAAATEEHEFHHSKNLGCFGSKLTIWNSLLGGYERYNNSDSLDKKKK